MSAIKFKVVDIKTTYEKPMPSNDPYLPLVELKNVYKAYPIFVTYTDNYLLIQ